MKVPQKFTINLHYDDDDEYKMVVVLCKGIDGIPFLQLIHKNVLLQAPAHSHAKWKTNIYSVKNIMSILYSMLKAADLQGIQ